LALTGCGGGSKAVSSTGEAVPAYVTDPPTHQQQLVREGARIAVVDGCTVCHLMSGKRALGPSFTSLAGHHVSLADGRTVLVDERFVTEVLSNPRTSPMRGWGPSVMARALARLHVDLPAHPHQVQALAAFIEEVGPED
jgi:cytochrome c551/c552